MTEILDKKNVFGVQQLSVFFLIFGIVIRLIQYLSNRSLWFDEVSLALNITQRSYLELLQPLDYNQAAPPGFLWIEKFSTQIFGNNEYALRLFPLIAGIVSLILFYQFANRYASKLSLPIAVALFACLPYTFYYATEVKQYSSDLAIGLIFLLWLVTWQYQFLNLKQASMLAGVGAVAIWISHPSIFTLGGIELIYLLTAQHRWRLLLNRLPVYLTWLLSFGLLYFFTILPTLGNDDLIESWGSRYPDSLVDFLWLLDALGRFFYRPMGFFSISDGVAMVTFVIGCMLWFRQKTIIALGLFAPFVVTLIASYLHQYPFRERLVLFLVPAGILAISEGINFLIDRSNRVLHYLGIIVLAILLIPPIFSAGKLIAQPQVKEEFRPVLAQIAAQRQSGDRLYVYFKGRNHFDFYGPKFGYTDKDYTLGQIEFGDDEVSPAEHSKYHQEIDQFQGEERVWLLFRTDLAQEATLLSYPNQRGKQLECIRKFGAFACLYSFS